MKHILHRPHHLHLPAAAAALLAVVTLAGCAQTAAPAASPPTAAASVAAPVPESQRLADELRTLIGPAACSADSECRAVAVGAKACGGPTGYLAWSSAQTDAQQLADLAQRQADANRRENAARRMVSTCSFEANPGATCVQGHCQLAARPASSSAR